MKVGDLVRVRTRDAGNKLGVVLKIDEDGIHVKPQKHPNNIIAGRADVTVLISA